MKSRVLFGVLALAFPVLSNAQANKPAWQWTTEERLAVRFDPANIRERDAAYQAAHPQLQARIGHVQSENAQLPTRTTYGIDGTRNPELFLPYELFDALLTGLQPEAELSAKQRAFYNTSLTKSGADPKTFWPTLESVSATYLPLRFGTDKLITREKVGDQATQRCRERFAALEAARHTFGGHAFDVILYTVVAPTMQFSESTSGDATGRLLREERGCQ